MRLQTWQRCSRGRRPGRVYWNLHADENLPLQIRYDCSICPVRFGVPDEIIDLSQRHFIVFDSDVCLRGNQRSESFSLRHDAAGFRRPETPRHRRRNS